MPNGARSPSQLVCPSNPPGSFRRLAVYNRPAQPVNLRVNRYLHREFRGHLHLRALHFDLLRIGHVDLLVFRGV
jgi:hypothetical protein